MSDTPCPIIEQLLPVERLTPADGRHYFFGYYDLPAWSRDQAFHLCQRVAFCDRLPSPDDVAEIGMIRLADKEFMPITRTTAWNFQQGCMLQWSGALDNTIIFNQRRDDGIHGVLQNVFSGEERLLPLPVANVDSSGRYAVSINFSRLFDFRPGYGYAGIPDPLGTVPQPENDGIFLIDLRSGESRLLLSLRDIAAARPVDNAKLLINHITFNTDGSRIVFLVRTFPPPGETGWMTAIFTVSREGDDLCLLQDYGGASHYHWRDPEHVLFYAEGERHNMDLLLFTDRTRHTEALDAAYFIRDGHCSYSPDLNWLLYDSYPIDDYRYLYLYDLQRRCGITLGAFYSPAPSNDFRCDLHPRWSPNGQQISFDSLHEGYRGVYRMDLSGIVSA